VSADVLETIVRSAFLGTCSLVLRSHLRQSIQLSPFTLERLAHEVPVNISLAFLAKRYESPRFKEPMS